MVFIIIYSLLIDLIYSHLLFIYMGTFTVDIIIFVCPVQRDFIPTIIMIAFLLRALYPILL
jgi:hypothetical protein